MGQCSFCRRPAVSTCDDCGSGFCDRHGNGQLCQECLKKEREEARRRNITWSAEEGSAIKKMPLTSTTHDDAFSRFAYVDALQ
jgi:hypothetical protein